MCHNSHKLSGPYSIPHTNQTIIFEWLGAYPRLGHKKPCVPREHTWFLMYSKYGRTGQSHAFLSIEQVG